MSITLSQIKNSIIDTPRETFNDENLPYFFYRYTHVISVGEIKFSTISVTPQNLSSRMARFSFSGETTKKLTVIAVEFNLTSNTFNDQIFGFLTYNDSIYSVDQISNFIYFPLL